MRRRPERRGPVVAAVTVDSPTSRSAIVTVVVLCFGGLCATLTQTIVIPIQAELPRFLGTSAANASWVITATLLTGAVTMPVAGRLGDLFGKQRVLVASALLLLLGSLVCALSNSLLPMLAGRVMQGLSFGFVPVGISLMREVTPARITPTAIAAMSATLGVGGAIGIPLSAYIAQDFDWHTLFWTSAGLATLVTLLVLVLVPHLRDGAGGRFDVVGAVGLAAGLVAVLVAVSKGNEWGWSQPRTLGCLLGGITVLFGWAWFELRQAEPLCDLRVSARRPVLLTNIASIAMGFGMMAQAIVVPQLLQLPRATGYGLGQSLLATGLWMAPGGLMMLFFAPVSSTVISRLGAKRALMIGGGFLGGGYLLAFFLMSAPWPLLLASSVSSAGVGISYAAMPTLILNSVPMSESGSAVGINGLMRSIGTSVASAVMIALLTGSTQALAGGRVPTQAAFQLCFVVGAGAALLGVAIAAFVPASRKAMSAKGSVMTVEQTEPSVAEPVLLGLRWAIKLSFVDYVMRTSDGQGTASAGATPTGNSEMVFEPAEWAGSTLPPELLSAGEVDRFWAFRGDVRFGGHFGMLFVRIADPWVTVRGDLAELTVVDPYNRQDHPRLRLVTFEVESRPSSSGLQIWSGTDVRLTPEGTELFNDVYAPGEPFEPLSITLPATAGTAAASTTMASGSALAERPQVWSQR